MTSSEGTKACRLCLAMDTSLIKIETDVDNTINLILGQNISYESGMPRYTCIECGDFLRKFTKFRQKSLFVQTILYNIICSNSEVTEQDIRKIDREKLGLDHESSKSHPQQFEYSTQVEITIKSEPIDTTDLDMAVEEEARPKCDYAPLQTGFMGHANNDNTPLQANIEQQKAEIEKTKKSANYKDAPFRCDICYKGFLKEETLKNHAQIHQVQVKSKEPNKVTNKKRYVEPREKANARKRRFLDNMTPEQRLLKRKKDLEYYHRKKAEKGRISVVNMSEEEKNKLREIWKKNSKKYRQKKKEKVINIEITPDIVL